MLGQSYFYINLQSRYTELAKLVFIIFILNCISCDEFDTRSDNEVKKIIDSNKRQRLFLSFWQNMSSKDFNRVLKYENQKGSLNNGKYSFYINNNETKHIKFNIMNENGSILLSYKDEYWIDHSGNFLPSRDGASKNYVYEEYEDALTKFFDKNYEPIEYGLNVPIGHRVKAWESKTTPNKVIAMNIYYGFWKNNSYDLYNKGDNRFISGEIRGPSMNENRTKAKLAWCDIKIVYMTKIEYDKKIALYKSNINSNNKDIIKNNNAF